MTALRLFPDDGDLRPPGVSDSIHPCPGYETATEAACENAACGYKWARVGQLHHTERLPY